MHLIEPHWNKVVRVARDYKPRAHIRASEIGMPFIDRYYSMMGEKPSNDFNDRVMRIFDAGRVVEFIVMRSLAQAGILNKKQLTVEIPETEEHLKIVGRLDATIGGFTNWDLALEQAQKNVGDTSIDIDSDFVEGKALGIIESMREEYPDGWPEEMAVEIKSINSMAFFSSKNRDSGGKFVGYDHNKLQLYSYLHATGFRQGILLYVSKDDFTLAEVSVTLQDSELADLYWWDIMSMSKLYRTGNLPLKEPEIIYNEKREKWEVNWLVERSPYLTKVYGYKDADDLESQHHQYLLDVNRAFKHLKEGKVKPEDEEHIIYWKMRDLIPF